MQNKTYKRRHILLLEVMIAFAIIVLCIFPLLYPHAMIAKTQREFIQNIELDHAVTLLFSQVYQDLQSNRIEWGDIENGKKFEIAPQDLQKYNNDKLLPFKGSYRFKKKYQKPTNAQSSGVTAYIYQVIFTFFPSQKVKNGKNTSRYIYEIFILRDLRKEKGSEEQPPSQTNHERISAIDES